MNIDRVASVADVVLGAWLLFSMIFWRSEPAHMLSAGVVGAAALVLGLMALRGRTWARWIASAFAVWLFASVWVVPSASVGMVVHHLTVATLLFGFSALPTGRGRATGELTD